MQKTKNYPNNFSCLRKLQKAQVKLANPKIHPMNFRKINMISKIVQYLHDTKPKYMITRINQ